MITGTELRILQLLFEDLTGKLSILQISKNLKIPYVQTHQGVKRLLKKELVTGERNGKALMISLNLKKEIMKEHIYAELIRKDKILRKYGKVSSVFDSLKRFTHEQYVCVLFGSYAKGKAKRDSDIDLLFIIPEEYDYGVFERNAKTVLHSFVDINIVPEKGLFEMWNTPDKFNVGNELLKGHIVLKGVEVFLNFRRRYHVG